MRPDAPGPSAPTACVGVLLAGGRSARMGRDKATLRLACGRTLAAIALEKLARVCGRVVVADGGRGVVPGASSLPDGAGRGPVAGLLGAAEAFPEDDLLTLACDLPGVTVATLERIARTPGADWVVPRHGDGRLEPLCARYAPRALATLRARVGRGEHSLVGLRGVHALRVAYVDVAELGEDRDRQFANLNTPEDLAAADTAP